jgi:thymidylate synthase
MPKANIESPGIVSTADDAYGMTLMDVLDRGHACAQNADSLSIGSGRESRELLNYVVRIDSPRERLVLNTKKRFRLPVAVARFVWMMAASDRLADIAFYEEKVRDFSDDGISVPGSNYGQRMLNPRPGLNQLKPAIDRLRKDPFSRRAAISIYQAEDAARESKDIPCTFGLFYHIREGLLLSTTLMRSNNAFTLLPYNLFEFSLLAEVVATDLNVPLGPMTHQAVSMHIYKEDYDKAAEAVKEWQNPSDKRISLSIPKMPKQPSALGQIHELIILESELRLGSAGITGTNIENWIAKGSERLHPFWRQLYFLLLLHAAKVKHDQQALLALDSVIEDPWHSYLPTTVFQEDSQNVPISTLTMQHPGRTDGLNVVPLFSSRAMQSLKRRALDWEKQRQQPLTWGQYAKVQEVLLETLAARGGDGFDGEITAEDFEVALRSIPEIDAQ